MVAPSWPRSLRKVPGAQCWASSPSPRGLVFLVVPCEQAAGWGQVAPPPPCSPWSFCPQLGTTICWGAHS